jgi:hypothetical protein
MKMRLLTMAAVVVAGAAGFAGIASAAPVTFTNVDINPGPGSSISSHPLADAAKASFLSHLAGATVFNFDSTATGTTTVTGSFGAVNFTLTGGAVATSAGGDNAGKYAISPNNYYDTSTQAITLAFSSAVSAFGFYGTDIGDFGGTLSITLTDTLNNTTSLTIPSATGDDADGSVLYYGFYDTAKSYTKIVFSDTNSDDGFGFDDFTLGTLTQIVTNPNGPGTGVPEPLTLSLFGVGLVGAVAISRRRKKA